MDLNVLCCKSDNEIIDEIGMGNLPLITHVLCKKYNGKYKLINIGNDCMIRFGETNVANISYLPAVIDFIEVEDNVLVIEGNVSWPYDFYKKMDAFALVNGKKKKLTFGDDISSKKINGELYEFSRRFSLRINIEKYSKLEISFVYICKRIKCSVGKINSLRFAPVADVLKNQYAIRNGWSIKIFNGKIVLCKDFDFKELEQKFQSTIHNENVCAFRNFYFERLRNKEKPIWLFMDRVEKADDNGEAFFKFVSKQNVNAECYFIISEDSPDFLRLKEYGNVIPALSDEHKLLLLLADYIFSSQLNGWVENPFGEDEEYFRDLYHQAKVVFLQHGVTKDNHSEWLNRYNQNLFGLITSSPYERESIFDYSYAYRNETVWDYGMPRFDYLYNTDSKYILIMPTWRQELMFQKLDEETNTYKWALKEGFTNCQYYIQYNELISSNRLKEVAENSNLKVLFMIHPLLQQYVNLFDIPKYVEVLPYSSTWRDIFAQSAIMITDYSSVAFDYAYLKKPLVYFQFDRDTFYEGHTYKQGYFDYRKMGFGPVTDNINELIDQIEKISESNCSMEEKYKERVNRFFTYTDGKNCERILKRVLQETDEL